MDFLPYIEVLGQEKIESLQESINALNSYGILPDAIICRTAQNFSMNENMKKRIARRCAMSKVEYVINNPNVDIIYKLP